MKEDPFVTNISIDLVEKMKRDLEEQGFEISKPPYSHFAAKKTGVSLTVYTSLKLVVQGKDKEALITYYLEPEILKTFNYTHPTEYVDKKPRIGIDEAGKGDFFGPLCVAGVYADAEGILKLLEWGVMDSKKLNDVKIVKIAKEIKKNLAHHVIPLFPNKYNELYPKFGNLNSMLAWGHAACIESLMKESSCEDVIIDQFASSWVVENALKRKNLRPRLVQRHKGEEDIVVAAASILARNAFVEGLNTMGEALGVVLPKGAGSHVKEFAKKIYDQYGEEGLRPLVKTHFKTWLEIVK